MRHEIDLGGVLISPFAADLAGAFFILLLLRPVLAAIHFGRLVANVQLAELAIYVCILTALVVLI